MSRWSRRLGWVFHAHAQNPPSYRVGNKQNIRNDYYAINEAKVFKSIETGSRMPFVTRFYRHSKEQPPLVEIFKLRYRN